MEHNAFIYSKKTCPYCVQAKEFLDGLEIPYAEYSLPDNMKLADLNIESLPADVKTVPQIFIDGNYIGGYDDLVDWAFEATC